MASADDITTLLIRVRAGDSAAADELLPHVYEDLHEKAAALMRGERRGITLQPTALVHEAWLRIARSPGAEWTDRGHFLRLAARAMRNALVDHARRRRRDARGNAAPPPRHEGDDADASAGLTVAIGPDPNDPADRVDMLDLQDALARLAAKDEQLERIVELRFFAGLTMQETGDALGLTVRQVQRAFELARAWLMRELGR
jgi:RNA polymerase sigma factor (TIGR02999 family)